MSLHFRPMDEATTWAIHTWRYELPYDIYNLAAEPAESLVGAFLDPQNAYYAIRDDEEEVVAYCCFGPDARVPGGDYGPAAAGEALDVGLGLRPDLTGQGQGGGYVQAVLDFARHRWAPAAFRVTVAEFNRRAQRVWEKAGFHQVQRFGRSTDSMPFVVLVRPAGTAEPLG